MNLEITSDDIAELDDSDLRSLIGLLCEADFRAAHLPTVGITWGGSQDASDGGIDVRVASHTVPLSSHVERKDTGFQVKKPDMPPAEIKKEMCLQGSLRESIKELIENKGSYIVVSSSASLTDTMLKRRLAAMRACVDKEDIDEQLHIDFFDRGRVATWVRSHPSLILWVRNRIGKSIQGWRSYGNWSYASETNNEFLVDDSARIIIPNKTEVSTLDGIQAVREALHQPGKSVRLVGLSGVGKTRFVQALFDQEVGGNPLNPTQVFYSDIADSPVPIPAAFVQELISLQTKAVVVIDNCGAELHERLSKLCQTPNSPVSLITIEYDISDDVPEKTEVFKIEAVGEELIARLVKKNYENISEIDAHTIASISGGNFRVAFAIAGTVGPDESLAGLRNNEIFKRLFWQNHSHNEDLLLSARVLSLVYSFDGENTQVDTSELHVLGTIVGKSARELYRHAATIRRRDLIQARGHWRAVLPHAIANRLAQEALEEVPPATIRDILLDSNSKRLMSSFSHRLNFLHDSKEAVSIAEDWLKQGNLLGDLTSLDRWQLNIFMNIAPLSPSHTLTALERAAQDNRFATIANRNFPTFTHILYHLAYDSDLFFKSTTLLCLFALSQNPSDNHNSVRSIIRPLFSPRYSGTEATVEHRLKFIEALLDSKNTEAQELGMFLLDAALDTNFHVSRIGYAFGARKRGFGYQADTSEKLKDWYSTFINFCVKLILSNHACNAKLRSLLAKVFRGLWVRINLVDLLEEASQKIHSQAPWYEGWHAVRETISYYARKDTSSLLTRTIALEAILRPTSLVDKIRVFIFRGSSYIIPETNKTLIEIEDFRLRRDWEKETKLAEQLGAELLEDSQSLNILLPELVCIRSHRARMLGQGLGSGSTQFQAIWSQLVRQLAITESGKRSVEVLIGYLKANVDQHAVDSDEVLDTILNDSVLKEWFVDFQSALLLNAKAVERLLRALNEEIVSPQSFKNLLIGNAYSELLGTELAQILSRLCEIEGGEAIAIELLSAKLYQCTQNQSTPGKELIDIGRKVLSSPTLFIPTPYGTRLAYQHEDMDLKQIADICLVGDEASACARNLSDNIFQYSRQTYDSAALFLTTIMTIASLQPEALLSAFFSDHSGKIDGLASILNSIDDEVIIRWCEKKPDENYHNIASSMIMFDHNSNNGSLRWKSVFFQFVEKAPNLAQVLDRISSSIHPSSWSGSLATVLQNNLLPYELLVDHSNQVLSAWAKDVIERTKKAIEREKVREKDDHRHSYESFE